jgi:hypothetical protein
VGPAPFRFVPDGGGPVEGAAYSLLFKLLGTAIVGSCAVWLAQLLASGVLATARSTGVVWFAAGLAMMAWTWWHILRSRTRVSTEGLYQGWIWDKHMAFDDLAYAKLIRIPGMDWLIAPRLYVRTLMGKFTVFYGATPALIGEFQRIVQELKAFRQL